METMWQKIGADPLLMIDLTPGADGANDDPSSGSPGELDALSLGQFTAMCFDLPKYLPLPDLNKPWSCHPPSMKLDLFLMRVCPLMVGLFFLVMLTSAEHYSGI